jgi:hypothetical protein
MTSREAAQLADSLSQYAMETQCRLAARLIRAMLRQVHSSDVFRLPPED